MLEALVAGERDPEVLAQYARQRMRSKIPELVEALTGRFGEHHAFMVRVHLEQIDHRTAAIAAFADRIEAVIEPYRTAREALITIPGVAVLVADVIIAETGADMSIFPTSAHLASWAGVCPGSNESAGHIKSTRTRPGNGEVYTEPGADYYLRRDPDQSKSRAVRQLKTLGYEVSLTPASA